MKKTKNNTRPIHRRIIFHPLSTLLLLCTGVLLATASFQSLAISYDVTAKVSADLPTSPAIITSHTDQQHVSASPITVTGTCPTQTYVQLYINDQPGSVSQCTNNLFSMQASLNIEANKLQAKVYNITNDEGPASPSIIVYYDIPSTPIPALIPPQNPQQTDGSQNNTSGLPLKPSLVIPLSIIHNYRYKVLYPDALWKWELTINGGATPYRTTIIWGDGNTTNLEPTNSKTLNISHTFNEVGEYNPIVQITDEQGAIALIQLSVIVKAYPNAATTTSSTVLGDIQSYLWIIWPSYIVILLMVISFWLGEYEVIQRLSANSSHRNHIVRK